MTQFYSPITGLELRKFPSEVEVLRNSMRDFQPSTRLQPWIILAVFFLSSSQNKKATAPQL